MTKSISRSQVRLIASTNAIFGADEACAMLRISRDAMYRLAPLALAARACYKVIGGSLSYLQVPGESSGYFFNMSRTMSRGKIGPAPSFLTGVRPFSLYRPMLRRLRRVFPTLVFAV